ncbi:MAG TPA: lysozyme inhibitor LprI family protein [Roseomonas sp.]
MALLGTIFCIANTQLAQAASFDCLRASTAVERLICADPRLSQLDDDLALAYRQALARAGDGQSLRSEQREWLRRRGACVDAACVAEAFTQRLALLRRASPTAPMAVEPQPRDPGAPGPAVAPQAAAQARPGLPAPTMAEPSRRSPDPPASARAGATTAPGIEFRYPANPLRIEFVDRVLFSPNRIPGVPTLDWSLWSSLEAIASLDNLVLSTRRQTIPRNLEGTLVVSRPVDVCLADDVMGMIPGERRITIDGIDDVLQGHRGSQRARQAMALPEGDSLGVPLGRRGAEQLTSGMALLLAVKNLVARAGFRDLTSIRPLDLSRSNCDLLISRAWRRDAFEARFLETTFDPLFRIPAGYVGGLLRSAREEMERAYQAQDAAIRMWRDGRASGYAFLRVSRKSLCIGNGGLLTSAGIDAPVAAALTGTYSQTLSYYRILDVLPRLNSAFSSSAEDLYRFGATDCGAIFAETETINRIIPAFEREETRFDYVPLLIPRGDVDRVRDRLAELRQWAESADRENGSAAARFRTRAHFEVTCYIAGQQLPISFCFFGEVTPVAPGSTQQISWAGAFQLRSGGRTMALDGAKPDDWRSVGTVLAFDDPPEYLLLRRNFAVRGSYILLLSRFGAGSSQGSVVWRITSPGQEQQGTP